jgi:hypothetical protein
VRPRVEVHIEQLVLRGLPAVDSRAVGDAVIRHLTSLVATNGVRAQPGAIPRVPGGSFRVTRASTAESIGASVARAVHTGVGR